MMTENVFYAVRPERVIVTRRGEKAVIEFPVNVTEVETEEGTHWLAATVYSLDTRNRDDIEHVVAENYDAWLEKAKEVEPQTTSLGDVIDALNALTDLILGGM